MGCGSSNTAAATQAPAPAPAPVKQAPPTPVKEDPPPLPKPSDELVDANNELIANQMAKDLAEAKLREAQKLEEEANKAAADAIALQIAEDLADKQIEQARALEEEANKAAAEAIANHMAADLAQKQMEEARKKEEEANKAAAEAIANQMAADLAQKQMEEARKKEEEANKAAAEAIANQMAADLADKKRAEAEAAEKAEKEAQEKQLMEMMKSLGAKQRFQAARESGKVDVMENAAAEIVQGCWRKKVARRQVAKKKEEKLILRKEYAARKFQSLYRTRIAKRRVVALREEKLRLMKEACARKLQCKYRSRLARKKVIRLRQEKQQLMEAACARKLQCKFRAHMARKKVHHLRAQKTKMMEEGYARKIQCRYRARLARKKVTNLRAQRQKLLEEAAAIKFQCAYRIRLARRKVNKMRAERGLPLTVTVDTSILIQKLWRGLKARKQVSALMREHHPHTLVLSLKGANRINTGDKSTPDPYIIAAAYSLSSRSGKSVAQGAELRSLLGTKKSRRGSTIAGPASDSMNLLCYSQSKVVNGTVNPVWNEDLLITGATWNSQIILTLVDQTIMKKVTVLGQKVIEIKNYPRLYNKGVAIDFNQVNIDSYLIRVQDPLGKDLVPPDTVPLPPSGTISFTLRLPPLAYNMCGWVMRESEGLMTLGNMKRRWVILLDGVLLYYEDQFTLNDCKGVLILDEVTSMTQINHKEGVAIVLTHGPNQSDNWTIMWDPNEPANINQMWERKLKRSLPKEVVAAYEASISSGNSKK